MAAPVWDLTNLELRARERTDMVLSNFVTSAEVQRYLEAGWQEFWGLICGEKPELLRAEGVSILSAGLTKATLSTPMKKLHGIRIDDGKTNPFLSKISLREREMFSEQQRGKPIAYELFGDAAGIGIWAISPHPVPDGAYTLRFFYSPQISLADIATSPSNYVGLDVEWSEYIVLCAAIKMKDKEESDCSVLMAEKGTLWANIKACWTPMDVGEAARVVQVSRTTGLGRMRGMSDDPIYEDEIFA